MSDADFLIFKIKTLFKINVSTTIKNTTIIYHYEIPNARTN